MSALSRPVAAGAFALVVAALSPATAAQPVRPDISGRWLDEACQARPTQYPIRNIWIRREFLFDQPAGAWGVHARFYADPQCLQPVFTLIVEGRYEITGKAALDGGWEGTFRFTRRAVVPFSSEAVAQFAAAGCGSAPPRWGVEVDVSETGCPPALSRPIAQSMQEFDLVQRDGDRIRFGVRTPYMGTPEGRPKALSPFFLSRLP